MWSCPVAASSGQGNSGKRKYLFKQKNLAKVFRARFLEELNKGGFPIPTAPCEWIVDCRQVGKGITAIKYLSKYLYKGVIGEKNIISDKNGKVTFRYVDSETKTLAYRTLPGEDFIYLILQHVQEFQR